MATPTESPRLSLQPRSRRRVTLRSAFATVGIAVLLAATLGASWQHAASTRARATTSPHGQLVDVGGRDLHLLVNGDGDGPAIVLEAGLWGSSAQWAWVQQHLAGAHTVVAYDRPGQGWSDADPRGVDPQRITTDLHAALQAQGIEGPWILVGHSMGGLLVRVFADRYADHVAGVVLIDSSHPQQPEAPGPIMGQVTRLLGRSGLLRASGAFDRQAEGLPTETLDHALPILNATTHLDGTARELQAFEQFGRAADRAGDLGATPLSVITAGDQNAAWHELRSDLTALSSSNRHVIVEDATHLSLVTDREHAHAVADEISTLTRRATRR